MSISRHTVKTLIFMLLMSQALSAQIYKFQQYDVTKGICHPFVYSITQDNKGFIWTLTGTGLCRFDGFEFQKNGGYKDSLPESSAETSFRDQSGNLWFGFCDGTIVFYNGWSFRTFRPAANEAGKITAITSDNQGNIIASNQNVGIIVINSAFQKKIIPVPNTTIFSVSITPENIVLLGTDQGVGVYRYNKETLRFVSKINELPLSKVNRIIKRNFADSYWVATEDAGLFLLHSEGNAKFIAEKFGKTFDPSISIQHIFEDRSKNIWISTFGKGLFKISPYGIVENFSSSTGLGRDDIKEVFQDREKNIWVATFGGGIVKIPGESFVTYSFKEIKDNNITAVCFDHSGYWVGGNQGILFVKNGNSGAMYFGRSAGLPMDVVTSLYVDKNESLWIGTDKNGIYHLLKSGRIVNFFRSDNSLSNSINMITGRDDEVYAGTKNGIYRFGIKTNRIEHYTTSQGLPHNDIRNIFVDPEGHAWIATHSNQLFSINSSAKFSLKNVGEIEFSSITRDASGNIWTGTNGTGVFKFCKDTFFHFSVSNGIRSDYCYAMVSDKWGDIWIGHRMGVSRINSKNYQIKTYGNEFFPGDINKNAIVRNSNGDIIFGTTDGLVYYKASTGKIQTVAPALNITSLIINDSSYNATGKIKLPYSSYRVKINFVGLNYSDPEQVYYQFKLEGFENEWSEPSKLREVRYPRLEDGKYNFRLRATNGDGAFSETILRIQISKPFWKMWWFYAILAVMLFTSIFLFIRIREKRQKEFQAHLEKLLEERTREVREQKEEIETINRDITDSINYAQRIQSSILPSFQKLQNLFTGSFVYYLPKNIVSGDFYWFEETPDKEKFVIVCADSTGHGVPGAFMSIIGTSLLKDLFMRPEITRPSDLLVRLDKELKAFMNQNLDGERPSDGMDIIVCEIDLRTLYAKFSSAMRPFIVYKNGEQLYFKGSKNSIGGQVKEEKMFEDVEIQLAKGDLIYMFSDGYPDQFGGPFGKKLKMVRLKNLLKDIYQKPMEEQYRLVKSNFEIWKGNLEQVDDVLFMGIKI